MTLTETPLLSSRWTCDRCSRTHTHRGAALPEGWWQAMEPPTLQRPHPVTRLDLCPLCVRSLHRWHEGEG